MPGDKEKVASNELQVISSLVCKDKSRHSAIAPNYKMLLITIHGRFVRNLWMVE